MNKILLVHENENFHKQIKYSSEIMFENYNICIDVKTKSESSIHSSKYDLIISYGETIFLKDYSVHIFEGKLFGTGYLKVESIPKKVIMYNDLPVLFYREDIDYFIEKNSEKLYINIDIIQTIFFFLSAYEDYVLDEYDDRGRFCIQKSLLYRESLINRLIINETLEFIINELKNNFNLDLNSKNYWRDKRFAVSLSHDVDIVKKYSTVTREIKVLLYILIKRRNMKEFLYRFKEYIKVKLFSKKDIYDTFDEILNLENKLGFKSSFYFMSDNSIYKLKSKEIKKLINKIISYGCEVGIHPGLNTCNNINAFGKQINSFKSILRINPKGARQHYLSFNATKTWCIQEKFSLTYDTTYGYPQVAGFKSSYCYPFKPYMLSEDRVSSVWEIPLNIMDGTLLHYMNLDFEEAKAYIIDLMNKTENYGGILTILWHNSSINSEYSIFSEDLFNWLYMEIYNRNCMVESHINIVDLISKSK